MNLLDLEAEKRQLTDEEIRRRREATTTMWKNLKEKESLLQQEISISLDKGRGFKLTILSQIRSLEESCKSNKRAAN